MGERGAKMGFLEGEGGKNVIFGQKKRDFGGRKRGKNGIFGWNKRDFW